MHQEEVMPYLQAGVFLFFLVVIHSDLKTSWANLDLFLSVFHIVRLNFWLPQPLMANPFYGTLPGANPSIHKCPVKLTRSHVHFVKFVVTLRTHPQPLPIHQKDPPIFSQRVGGNRWNQVNFFIIIFFFYFTDTILVKGAITECLHKTCFPPPVIININNTAIHQRASSNYPEEFMHTLYFRPPLTDKPSDHLWMQEEKNLTQ